MAYQPNKIIKEIITSTIVEIKMAYQPEEKKYKRDEIYNSRN